MGHINMRRNAYKMINILLLNTVVRVNNNNYFLLLNNSYVLLPVIILHEILLTIYEYFVCLIKNTESNRSHN